MLSSTTDGVEAITAWRNAPEERKPWSPKQCGLTPQPLPSCVQAQVTGQSQEQRPLMGMGGIRVAGGTGCVGRGGDGSRRLTVDRPVVL